jgi:cytochrome P450
MTTARNSSSLEHELRLLLERDPETIQDPYPVYNRLREEAPVHRYDANTVILSRYADVRAAYLDNARFLSNPVIGSRFEGQLSLLSPQERNILEGFQEFERNFISRQNGADHRRIRRAVGRYFAPRRTASFEPIFQGIFDELLERNATDGAFDFMEIAYRLPLLVICEILDVPREDAERVKAWGDAMLTEQNPIEPEFVHAKRQALAEYWEYTDQLVRRHRDDPESSELVAATLDAAQGDELSEHELVAFFLHTLLAGHETTEHLIGNGLRALLINRDQWEQICCDATLVPGAVEEMLRWDPPTSFFMKSTACEVQIGDTTIPAGTQIMLANAAANRDPAVYADPDLFDIRRFPNDHAAFGFGVHFCLGASLARLEGRIVFETLARRFPSMDLAVPPESLRFDLRVERGLEALPVTVTERRP